MSSFVKNEFITWNEFRCVKGRAFKIMARARSRIGWQGWRLFLIGWKCEPSQPMRERARGINLKSLDEKSGWPSYGDFSAIFMKNLNIIFVSELAGHNLGMISKIRAEHELNLEWLKAYGSNFWEAASRQTRVSLFRNFFKVTHGLISGKMVLWPFSGCSL